MCRTREAPPPAAEPLPPIEPGPAPVTFTGAARRTEVPHRTVRATAILSALLLAGVAVAFLVFRMPAESEPPAPDLRTPAEVRPEIMDLLKTESLPEVPDSDEADEEPTAGAELPPETIAKVLRETDLIRSCFDREHDFVGVVELKFTVRGDGRVTSSEVLTERVQGTGLELCLRLNLLLLSFPTFEGEPMTVVYPTVVG